jgi:hypothetical protein
MRGSCRGSPARRATGADEARGCPGPERGSDGAEPGEDAFSAAGRPVACGGTINAPTRDEQGGTHDRSKNNAWQKDQG